MATTPYPFVSGTVLTASQLNSTFNIPTTTKTASHTLIAADAGTRVIMNSASATTITVNTSIFAASDVLEIQNIGAGVCTVTAGTATVASAGPLAIPQNGGGRLVFSSASAATYFPTAVNQTPSALTLINSTTFTTAASVSLPTNTFSATYDNYLVIIQTSAISTTMSITGRFRAAGTDNSSAEYNNMFNLVDNAAGGNSSVSNSSQTSFTLGTAQTDRPFQGMVQVTTPFLTQRSCIHVNLANQTGAGNRSVTQGVGQINLTTSFDSFSFICSTGTFTGTVRVYGYANS